MCLLGLTILQILGFGLLAKTFLENQGFIMYVCPVCPDTNSFRGYFEVVVSENIFSPLYESFAQERADSRAYFKR